MENPFLHSVQLIATNTPASLVDLLVTAGFPIASQPDNPDMIEFTIDLDAPNGSLYIGNSDVSATMWGKKLIPGIGMNWGGLLAPCSIKSIWLMTDATVSEETPMIVGVTIIQR